METIFRLHNLRYLFRILQTKSDSSISRIHHSLTHKIGLTPSHGRTTVFRIHTGQSREFRFALIHAIGILTQPSLHIFYFSNRNFRLQSNNLYLYLCRNIRDTILRKIFEITTYFGRSYFNISHKFLLHLLYGKSLARIFTKSFTYLRRSFVLLFKKVFFHLFPRAQHLYPMVGHRVHSLNNFTFGNLDTIKTRLM